MCICSFMKLNVDVLKRDFVISYERLGEFYTGVRTYSVFIAKCESYYDGRYPQA